MTESDIFFDRSNSVLGKYEITKTTNPHINKKIGAPNSNLFLKVKKLEILQKTMEHNQDKTNNAPICIPIKNSFLVFFHFDKEPLS